MNFPPFFQEMRSQKYTEEEKRAIITGYNLYGPSGSDIKNHFSKLGDHVLDKRAPDAVYQKLRKMVQIGEVEPKPGDEYLLETTVRKPVNKEQLGGNISCIR
jgi:hypothetical protein